MDQGESAHVEEMGGPAKNADRSNRKRFEGASKLDTGNDSKGICASRGQRITDDRLRTATANC